MNISNKKLLSKKGDVLAKMVPILLGTIIGVWCIAYLFFIFWGLISSVKTYTYFNINPLGITYQGKINPFPGVSWRFDNYWLVIENMERMSVNGEATGILEMMKNSLLYCVGNAVLCNATMTLATYMLSKYKHFKWIQVHWWVFLFTCFIPFNADAGSEIKMQMTLGVYDSMIGNWLYNCGAYGGQFLWMLGAWNAIDKTLMEAAQMDGANSAQIFFKIMLPQTIGLYFVLVLTKISGLWDDYMPMLMQLPSYQSVASGIFAIQGSGYAWATETLKIASLFILSAPMIIIYFASKSKIMKAMSSMEGIKG